LKCACYVLFHIYNDTFVIIIKMTYKCTLTTIVHTFYFTLIFYLNHALIVFREMFSKGFLLRDI